MTISIDYVFLILWLNITIKFDFVAFTPYLQKLFPATPRVSML